MLRHSVLWTLRDTTTAARRVEMLEGLAFLGTECPMVRHGDYGEDLFGGSRDLRTPPRTPMWRRDGLGPEANFDVALHLDFDDWSGHQAYSADTTHGAASTFNESVSWDELTARVDWYYEGERPTRRGHVRHVAMFVWADGVGDAARERAIDALTALGDLSEVETVATGANVGVLQSDYDWILDLQLRDRLAAERLLGSSAYAEAMEAVAPATRYEWTARVTHLVRGR
ncbi:MAG TPA: Dabb family protein [Gaiellaceae bacterium]|nr:Dabb family protein [Gaiellaceae bacterium]